MTFSRTLIISSILTPAITHPKQWVVIEMKRYQGFS